MFYAKKNDLQSIWQASKINGPIQISRQHFSSTEKDVNNYLVKALNAIDMLSFVSKFDQYHEIKQDCFYAVTVSILLYGCTPWTLTKKKACRKR